MNGPLKEEGERDDETETETSGQCLRPSKQPSANSSEDLQPTGKETLDVHVELEEPAVEPNLVKELLD